MSCDWSFRKFSVRQAVIGLFKERLQLSCVWLLRKEAAISKAMIGQSQERLQIRD